MKKILKEIYNLMGKLDPSYNLLTEAISTDDAYMKFYSNIDKDVYDSIIGMDMANPNKMTPLRKWLLDIYRRENFEPRLVNDIVGAYNALPDNVKNEMSTRFNRSNPTCFKNLSEFSDAISGTIEKGNHITKKARVENDSVIFYEDEKWIVVTPLTQEASRKWGAHSQWCTADSQSFYFFYEYCQNGMFLLMFINKENIDDSYQACVESTTSYTGNENGKDFSIYMLCDNFDNIESCSGLYSVIDKYIRLDDDDDYCLNMFSLVSKGLEENRKAIVERLSSTDRIEEGARELIWDSIMRSYESFGVESYDDIEEEFNIELVNDFPDIFFHSKEGKTCINVKGNTYRVVGFDVWSDVLEDVVVNNILLFKSEDRNDYLSVNGMPISFGAYSRFEKIEDNLISVSDCEFRDGTKGTVYINLESGETSLK